MELLLLATLLIGAPLFASDTSENEPADNENVEEPLDLTGSDQRDMLEGGALNDTISGADGDDTVYGDTGADIIGGGAGNDWIDAGTMADSVNGGDHSDTLIGGSGHDTLAGDAPQHGIGGDQPGNDLLYGDAGNDWLGGNGGTDTLIGGDGDDKIFDFDLAYYDGPNESLVDGGAGNDTIQVDAGSTITGGDGEDEIMIYQTQDSSSVTEITDFDPAEDRLQIVLELETETTNQFSVLDTEDGTGAQILLGDTVIATLPGAAGLQESDVEFVVVLDPSVADYQDGEANTTITGNSSDNILQGGDGDDALLLANGQGIYYQVGSNGGEDMAFGGDGNDTLEGQGGLYDPSAWDDEGNWLEAQLANQADTLIGGAGDDVFLSYNGNELTGGEGADIFGIAHETPEHTENLAFAPTVITDFDPAEDSIAVQVGPIYGWSTYETVSVEVWEDGTGADILLDGAIVAQVHGGQSLSADQIQQVQSLSDLP